MHICKDPERPLVLLDTRGAQGLYTFEGKFCKSGLLEGKVKSINMIE